VQPVYLIYVVPVFAVVALLYAYFRAAWVRRQDEGTDRMKQIGGWHL